MCASGISVTSTTIWSIHAAQHRRRFAVNGHNPWLESRRGCRPHSRPSKWPRAWPPGGRCGVADVVARLQLFHQRHAPSAAWRPRRPGSCVCAEGCWPYKNNAGAHHIVVIFRCRNGRRIAAVHAGKAAATRGQALHHLEKAFVLCGRVGLIGLAVTVCHGKM